MIRSAWLVRGLGIFLLSLLVFSALGKGGTADLLAHGGSLPRVSDVEAGPYRLFIWAEPVPAVTGEINFTVAVTEIPASENAQADPVLNADVQIALERVDGPARALSGTATHEEAINKLMYETYIDISRAGVWRTTVTVDSPAGTGTTAFEFDVLPGPGVDWTWPALGGLGLVILIIVVRYLRRAAPAKAPVRPGARRTKRT